MTPQEKYERKLQLEAQLKNGVSWFYWIGALSLINTLIIFFDGSLNFIAGLGITQIVDAIAYSAAEYRGEYVLYIGLFVNLIIIGMFFVLGILANKRKKWVIIIGLVIYSADALLFMLVKDYIYLAFHAYAVYCIISGLQACNKLSEYENATLEAESQAAGEAHGRQ